jgi:hypothetical protein
LYCIVWFDCWNGRAASSALYASIHAYDVSHCFYIILMLLFAFSLDHLLISTVGRATRAYCSSRIKTILFVRNSMNQAVHGCASAWACSPCLHARFKELKERKAWGGLAQAASFPHSTTAVRRHPRVLVEWRPTRRRKRWNETKRNKCVREFVGTGSTGCSALRIGGPSELGALFDRTARMPIGTGLLIIMYPYFSNYLSLLKK